MSFVALDRDDPLIRYAIRELDDPRQDLAEREFVCQACGYPMYIKGGTDNVRFHFAHFPEYPTTCPYFAHERMGDSKHEAGKVAVMAYLRRFEQYVGSVMLDEVYIAPRIADVLVTHLSGSREIHEVQLSFIAPEELLERTRDYNRAGVDFVAWWLGGPMLAKSNVGLMREFFSKTGTLIEFADWPILLNKRNLWPEEIEQLRMYTEVYGWSEVPMEKIELTGKNVTRWKLKPPKYAANNDLTIELGPVVERREVQEVAQ